MRAAVRIEAGAEVRGGDYLVHSRDGARPQGASGTAREPFARVVTQRREKRRQTAPIE